MKETEEYPKVIWSPLTKRYFCKNKHGTWHIFTEGGNFIISLDCLNCDDRYTFRAVEDLYFYTLKEGEARAIKNLIEKADKIKE